MSFTPEFFIFVLLFIWLIILTVLFIRFSAYYTKLIRHGKKESLTTLLDEVVTLEEKNKKALDVLAEEYLKLKEDGLSHVQKVGLVRFNPFKDTGGDQSFILALVDANNTGIVISSLHTRTGTRWYAKNIIQGKGSEYDLSDDEQKALAGAQFLSKEKSKK
jgi:hypothetical protein